ncbi:unnamed protein product [Didymodactylos carnosus]|uniref:Uncharacterized protein n=1 Tax=Didymodactylos carnosus TaxID=1234261 RepID=A0A815VMA9_9BILA|nr:unnamed protein product [Didymodactylos carnosus]CAF1534113.1 unnamed protein product [Didymodactylos carnosus]CAF3867775.1 unnamed protein product [Didymodactylos carnosus]CAF4393796.1 unnamed protein product [Didymodactylos carnosus]
MVNVGTLTEAVSALPDSPSEITAESLTSVVLTEAVILSSANTMEATIEPLAPAATGSSRVPQSSVATYAIQEAGVQDWMTVDKAECMASCFAPNV